MTEIMPDVHDWTMTWYDTLPESYRMLDKTQIVSRPPQWDALTSDPRFFAGWSKWTVTAPVQTVDEVMVSMTQEFQGIPGEPIVVQVWWAAPLVEGTLLQVSKLAKGIDPELEITVEPIVGVDDQTELTFYPVGDGKFTIRILILVPAPEGNVLDIRGVNVGPKRIGFADMPVGGIIAPVVRPLLRFMDGIGRVGGGFRVTSDALWDGHYTNPATAPAASLQWLAQMMGVPNLLRGQLPPDRLREYMTDMTTNGRQGTGTRAAIADAARGFLTGDRMVEVIPHGTLPHTLVILVKADEVPGGDLNGIVTTVRAAGVVPAGHDLIAKEAIATWDAWELAAGLTWTELETAAPTQVRADSLGIDLEG